MSFWLKTEIGGKYGEEEFSLGSPMNFQLIIRIRLPGYPLRTPQLKARHEPKKNISGTTFASKGCLQTNVLTNLIIFCWLRYRQGSKYRISCS